MLLKEHWKTIRYFKPQEFDSPDAPGSGVIQMQDGFVCALDRMRDRAKIPFHINSGYRTPDHNTAVGGRANSAHLRGWAADIVCTTPHALWLILDAAWFEGIRRIGVYQSFVHVDMDPSLPAYVVWRPDQEDK